MSVFKMPDVNFLFAGPFRPLRVLFHGMLNQMATALIMAVVILFQYGWMHTSYGVGFGGLLIFVLGYGLAVFTGQLTAMVIYCLSSGRDRVRKALRFVYVAVTALWALYLGWRALGAESALDGLCDAMVDPIGRLFPVAGWLGAACYEALLGNFAPAALLTLLWAAYSAALVIIMVKGRPRLLRGRPPEHGDRLPHPGRGEGGAHSRRRAQKTSASAKPASAAASARARFTTSTAWRTAAAASGC